MNVINDERDTTKDIMEKTLIFVREEINEDETEANVLNGSNSERSDYEGGLCRATGDECDYLLDNNNDGYRGGFSGKSENLIEQSHYNVDDEEDVDMDDDVDDDIEDGQADLDVPDYIIGGDSNAGYSREENAEKTEGPDGVGSTSFDCSD